ncbi:MAG: hypothetical protein HYT73_03620 [Candidatus Aenigmarchaeota archaeon]|nr:hypothetical protein [Candidatus Aenigmarchaeota archaeon]
MVHTYSLMMKARNGTYSPAGFFDVQDASIRLLGALGYEAETCFDGNIQTGRKLDDLVVGALEMTAMRYRGIPVDIRYMGETSQII